MATEDRLRCLVLGQQIGDNVADMSGLMDDLVLRPRTPSLRMVNTLVGEYYRRIDEEMKIAIAECGLPAGDELARRWNAFGSAWESYTNVDEIRDALSRFHDLLDLGNAEPREFRGLTPVDYGKGD